MSSSLDTSTAPSASSSTMSNTQSSPNNAATDFSTNPTGNLIGPTDAASTSSRTTEPTATSTTTTNTKGFDSTTTTTDAKFGDTDKSNANDTNGSKKDDSMFECNICLDTAKEAVVSMCGHLFCWPCLHQWLETRPTRQLCPVCKAAISKEKVIPLYGRGSTKEEDPRYVPVHPSSSLIRFTFKTQKQKLTIALFLLLQFKSSATSCWSTYRTGTEHHISRIWIWRWRISNVTWNRWVRCELIKSIQFKNDRLFLFSTWFFFFVCFRRISVWHIHIDI